MKGIKTYSQRPLRDFLLYRTQMQSAGHSLRGGAPVWPQGGPLPSVKGGPETCLPAAAPQLENPIPPSCAVCGRPASRSFVSHLGGGDDDPLLRGVGPSSFFGETPSISSIAVDSSLFQVGASQQPGQQQQLQQQQQQRQQQQQQQRPQDASPPTFALHCEDDEAPTERDRCVAPRETIPAGHASRIDFPSRYPSETAASAAAAAEAAAAAAAAAVRGEALSLEDSSGCSCANTIDEAFRRSNRGEDDPLCSTESPSTLVSSRCCSSPHCNTSNSSSRAAAASFKPVGAAAVTTAAQRTNLEDREDEFSLTEIEADPSNTKSLNTQHEACFASRAKDSNSSSSSSSSSGGATSPCKEPSASSHTEGARSGNRCSGCCDCGPNHDSCCCSSYSGCSSDTRRDCKTDKSSSSSPTEGSSSYRCCTKRDPGSSSRPNSGSKTRGNGRADGSSTTRGDRTSSSQRAALPGEPGVVFVESDPVNNRNGNVSGFAPAGGEGQPLCLFLFVVETLKLAILNPSDPNREGSKPQIFETHSCR
ncbi:hypothetical protein Emag_000284 [Eimeria magna]